jgi:hypothetical protein
MVSWPPLLLTVTELRVPVYVTEVVPLPVHFAVPGPVTVMFSAASLPVHFAVPGPVLLVTADKKTIEVVLDREGKILKEEKQEKKKEKHAVGRCQPRRQGNDPHACGLDQGLAE